VPIRVARAAVDANERPVAELLAHMKRDLGGLAGARIAVWGLAFKPKTDDVREAPALRLIEGLVKAGAQVVGSDPEALETSKLALSRAGLLGDVTLTADYYGACEGADALVVATEWLQYQSPDIDRLARSMKRRFVFDGRNVLSPAGFKAAGFAYRGIGRR
jgi:UDPglucose 6-dehydrogenase